MSWTTPAQLEEQLARFWDDGRILGARLAPDPLFPLALRLKRPTGAELGARFDEVRRWIRELEEGSRAKRGFGYELEWAEVNHRELGRNRVPRGAVIPTEEDALRLLRRTSDAQRFHALADATRASTLALEPWLARSPLRALEHATEWTQILSVVSWFNANPRPKLYLRQLELPGVDTKFIEAHRGLIAELLDEALPEEAVDRTVPPRDFERRYGLRAKPPLVRLRSLDPAINVGGLTDVTARPEELGALGLPVRRAFIVENEITGLAFPEVTGGVVLFGLGYAVERLAPLRWLDQVEVHYWGDLDTHGFAILDRLRSYFPEAHSLLMDRETLLAHRPMWVTEDRPFLGELVRLNPEEREVLRDLQHGVYGERVRLEQERVGFGYVRRAVEGLLDA